MTNVKNIEDHLKATRKQRIELSNKMLGVIEGIIQRSDESIARDIYAFLEGSTVYGEPIYKEGRGPGVLRHTKDGEETKTAVVFLLEEDKQLNGYIQTVLETGKHHGHIGKYLENWRTIFIDTSEPISDLWLALIFLHEGAHAFHHQEGRYRSEDDGFWREERDVLKMEITLSSELGGEDYQDVVQSHLETLRKSANITEDGIENISRPLQYPPGLDDAFGEAQSDLEKRVRGTIVFYDALFRYIEEVYKEESRDSQALFLKQEAEAWESI